MTPHTIAIATPGPQQTSIAWTMSEELPTLIFSPHPSCYSAIRMDPVAMVKDLGDEIALAAAQAMTPKTYLIYLRAELELPFPDRPWYRYTVSVIGPSLRQEDSAKGYTPDMCIPIYPNTVHPTGREPLRPDKPFPYKNCYHWMDMETDIRVLSRPEMFDLRVAVRLPPSTRRRIDRHWFEDCTRMREAALAREDAPESAPTHPAQLGVPSSALEGEQVSASDVRSNEIPSPNASSDSLSSRWDWESRSSIDEENGMDSVEAIMQMGIFSGPDQDLELLPLFELWEDLGTHLKEEDVRT